MEGILPQRILRRVLLLSISPVCFALQCKCPSILEDQKQKWIRPLFPRLAINFHRDRETCPCCNCGKTWSKPRAKLRYTRSTTYYSTSQPGKSKNAEEAATNSPGGVSSRRRWVGSCDVRLPCTSDSKTFHVCTSPVNSSAV